MTARKVLASLRKVARSDKAEFLPGFFQAVPGGYGEGDRFLGCVVPDQRKIAKQFCDLSRAELSKLFVSPWHECRLTGMLILVHQFQQANKPRNKNRESECREIVHFYLANLDAVNNWDIVDTTSPKILGAWLLDNPSHRDILKSLAKSDVLWRRRVAVLATHPIIKNDEFAEILWLADQLMNDPHDLMHKAIGWMLREMGKCDEHQLKGFLDVHARRMPRTMLRYAIERLPKSQKQRWMTK